MVRRGTIGIVVLGLLAACGGDDGGDDDDAAGPGPTESAPDGGATDDGGTDGETDDGGAAVRAIPAFADRGPFGVGSLELDMEGRRVVVWYPSADEDAGGGGTTDTFDIASQLSPDLQAQIPDDARSTYPVAAAAGAEPAEPDDDSGFPLVVFSHGFAGFPEQSVSLTTHLASWGFVVAAPEHVERSLGGLLGVAAQGVAPMEDPAVLSATLDLLGADEAPAPELDGLVDDVRVAVVGHSAGAGAAYRTALADDRIDAFSAMSIGTGGDAGLGGVPDVPGLVMLGETDETIPAQATRDVFATLTAPSYLLELAGAGHLVFSDLCLIGAEQGGLVGTAQSIGLEIPEQFLRLASDGCGADDPPVTDAFPAVDALTVAFLRTHLLGEDETGRQLETGPLPVGEGATLTVG